MRVIPVVHEDEAALAREIEQRLLATQGSGILFAGVDVQVEVEQHPLYRLGSSEATMMDGCRTVRYLVWLGADRSFEEKTIEFLALQLLNSWYPGLTVDVTARRGCARPALLA
jgi:hypothetical protein